LVALTDLVYHFELNSLSIVKFQIGHSGGAFSPFKRSQSVFTGDDKNKDQNELCALCFKKECFLLTKERKQQKLPQNGFLVMCA